MMKKLFFVAFVAVFALTSCEKPEPVQKINPVLGKVTFKTDKTWVVENGTTTQEWSDAVMVANARGKTTYDGGNDEDGFKADFRENEGYGDLFSWEAVNQYGDDLCPGKWRVPTKEEFIALDIALGGQGINVWLEEGSTQSIDTFLNAEVWGGELGGYCNGKGEMSSQNSTGYYWSQSYPDYTNLFGYSFSVNSAMVYVDFAYDKDWGFTLRCIK